METARSWRIWLGVSVVLLGVVGLVAVAPGVVAEDHGAADSELAAGISGFMQATAADASESTESGMWAKQFERETDPDRAVERRAGALRSRLTDLSERSEALEAARRSGTVGDVEYIARASAIHARLAELRSSIDQTAESARQRGVSPSGLDRLRESAKITDGPEVSAIARDIAGGGRGPPATRGPPDDAGNGDRGSGDGEPPTDAGNGDRGSGDGGPPTDAGNGDQGSGDGEPPTDAGNGDQANDDSGQSGDAGTGGGPGNGSGTGTGSDRGGGSGSSNGQGAA